MNEKYAAEFNWTEPCDDEINEEHFSKEIQSFGSNYNMSSNTWHPTMLDGFKLAVENEFTKFSIESKLIWEYEKSIDGKFCIKLTISTKDLGKISTEIPMEYLTTLPKELPEQLVQVFEGKFEMKRKRLLKEWSKQSNSKK